MLHKKIIFLLIFTIFFINFSSSVPQAAKNSKKSAISDQERQKFQSWKQKHKKSYQSSADEDKAMNALVQNMREIEAHNKLYAAGKTTYTRALWEKSDLSFEEKQQFLSGEKVFEPRNETTTLRFVRAAKLKAAPPELNWVREGLVNPIQDQKKCGSCWTYAAAGVAEGVLLKKGIKTRLSEQNLVDCSKNGGNSGCNGGDAYYALKYIAGSGIASFDDYPYTAKTGKCRASSFQKVQLKLGNVKFEKLRGNENRLRDIVANYGPVAVAIRAADSFMNYESGVYNYPKCSRNLDHAVLLVGYGHDNRTNMDFWLVKNSWGTTWGENGYVRMARNKDNQCGIAAEVSYVV